VEREKKKIPQNIIILDDVMTTGATLNEMARVLKNGGAKNVWGLIVAREIFI
jgi:predicted amidophosphoribosyltransferase